MSDDGSDVEKVVEVIPIPSHKMRFSDMSDILVEKAIRSKYYPQPSIFANLIV